MMLPRTWKGLETERKELVRMPRAQSWPTCHVHVHIHVHVARDKGLARVLQSVRK